MNEALIALATSLAAGLLIGLERERNADAVAGARTFALLALLGALAALVGAAAHSGWLVPAGLAAVAAALVAASWRAAPVEDPGTTRWSRPACATCWARWPGWASRGSPAGWPSS